MQTKQNRNSVFSSSIVNIQRNTNTINLMRRVVLFVNDLLKRAKSFSPQTEQLSSTELTAASKVAEMPHPQVKKVHV